MADKKIAIKWIEALLLIVILLVGLGLGTLAASFIESERELRRPREEAYIRNADLLRRQAEATASQAELNTLHSKLTEQEIERAKQSAKLDSFKAIYPALNTPEADDDESLKPEVKTAFAQLQLDFDSSGRVLADLKNRLTSVKADAQNKATQLNETQEAMRKDFEQAQTNYRRLTHLITFVVSLVLSIIVIAIAGLIVRYFNQREQFGIRTNVLLLSGFAILLVLTSYQALQVAGATLAVIVVVVIAMILALRAGKEAGAT
jgi:lipopolysaccharide export LptBFGC system permease protein LptF